jgi:hypothetical protein
MRCVACYPTSVKGRGRSSGAWCQGRPWLWHETSELASLDAAPARMTLTETVCETELEEVRDHPQAQMTRLIHPFRSVGSIPTFSTEDSMSATASTPTRFVALDIHRKYLVVGAVDAQQQVILTPRRFGFDAFSSWARSHLTPSDAVVLEATANAWLFYDQLVLLVVSVTVAHPLAVKLIAAACVKPIPAIPSSSRICSLLTWFQQSGFLPLMCVSY